MNNRTLAIIKPDAVKNNYVGKIYDHILNKGFKVLSAKLLMLTKNDAENFYLIHKDKPFYEELTSFMSSGKCMVLALEKDNAVDNWREVIGSTNPADAENGTIRKLYATSLGENAVHGSDSDDNAKKEISFFFSELENL